jgi:hypothetical protein
MTISYFEQYEKNKDWDEDYETIRYRDSSKKHLEELYFKYSDIAFADDPSGFCKRFSRLVYAIFCDNRKTKFPEEMIWDCIKRPSEKFDYERAQIQWACLNLQNCPKEVYEHVLNNREKYREDLYHLAYEKLAFLKIQNS